jgi:hypothetical protein
VALITDDPHMKVRDVELSVIAAWILNVALRIAIIYFAVEAFLAAPDDPRFAGKGIAMRDLVLAGGAMTLAIPVLHLIRPRWDRYPVWSDVLFLSILALDMAGNSFGLYEQSSWRFDLIPHAYGPAAALVGLHLLGFSIPLSAIVVNVAHGLLEIQEVFGDVVFGTSNVNGWWDSFSDLAAGLIASLAVAGIWWYLERRRDRPRAHRSYSVRP